MPTALNRWRLLATLLFLTAPVALGASAVFQKSVTVDEFQALPHGLTLLKAGDFSLATTTQPLSQYLPAVPVLLAGAKLDTSQLDKYESTWALGIEFMDENRTGYHRFFQLGRMVSVLVLWATCLLAFGFARSLYGPTGGLLTAAVVGLSPSLLAHGPLITPDIYLAACVIAALWAFDALLRRPSWRTGVLLGLALGAACLAKLTGALLFLLFPLVLLGFQAADRWKHATETGETTKELRPMARRAAWASMFLALLVGLLVINLGCLGKGSFMRLDQYSLEAPVLKKVQAMLPSWLPVPLPYAIFKGADFQLTDSGYVSYLLGKFSPEGSYFYYVVGLVVKTPVPVLLLGLLALACDFRLRRREIPLLACGLALFCFFSLSRHKNIGLRYVLFLEPLMAVWIGRLTASPMWVSPTAGRRLVGAATVGIVCLAAIALLAWPNYLAYFNLVSGGPARGHRYLLDSNLDWGQDLITLRRYMDREGIPEIDLAYFGRVDPAIYGIRFRHLGRQQVGRYVAISANFLWGRSYFMNGTGVKPPPEAFWEFRNLKPKAILGYTIYVYDMANLQPRSP